MVKSAPTSTARLTQDDGGRAYRLGEGSRPDDLGFQPRRVVLDGTRASCGAYAIRDFLSCNGYPFEWVDAGQPQALRAVLDVAEVEPSALPLCILPDGSRLVSATVE